jgi:site-specific DNA recombinase
MSTETRPAVIYCRVSSKSQENDGHGLESQETRCREYAASKGYEVEAVFPDTFTGGGDFIKRPGMVALLSYLDAMPDQSYVVIFDDLKRFARDTRFHLDLRDAFRSRDALIECLNFKFDDTPEGEFIETIMAAQGALERKQNGRQVSQKMKARMQSGYWTHSAPIGFKYVTVKGRGKMLEPNEPLASVIQEAFEGFASGRYETHSEVKRLFESSLDFPRNSKGKIPFQRVTDILTHPIYAGYICSETYGIHWLKGQHEPLISLDTFEKVQERRKGPVTAPTRQNIGDDFALRGFVACGDCSVPLRSCWTKGKYKRYPYYLCQNKGCDSYGKSIARDKLEGDVGQLIKTLQPSETLFAMVRVMFRQAWDMRSAQAQEASASIKAQLSAAEKQVESLLVRIIDAESTTVIRAYEGKIAEIEMNKLKLRDQMIHRSQPKGKFDDVLELSLQFLANPWKLWESGHITLRRTVLRLAFTERLQYHRKTGARTPKTALVFKALGGQLSSEIESGAAEKTRTSTGVTPQRPQRCASTIPPQPHTVVGGHRLANVVQLVKRQSATKIPRCDSAAEDWFFMASGLLIR